MPQLVDSCQELLAVHFSTVNINKKPKVIFVEGYKLNRGTNRWQIFSMQAYFSLFHEVQLLIPLSPFTLFTYQDLQSINFDWYHKHQAFTLMQENYEHKYKLLFLTKAGKNIYGMIQFYETIGPNEAGYLFLKDPFKIIQKSVFFSIFFTYSY